jgi:hypothetical protein
MPRISAGIHLQQSLLLKRLIQARRACPACPDVAWGVPWEPSPEKPLGFSNPAVNLCQPRTVEAAEKLAVVPAPDF